MEAVNMPRRFTTKLKMPADGVTLEAELETDKGVRMLRVMREFVRSPSGVSAIDVDGQRIYLIKYDQARHADISIDADGEM